MILTQLPAAQGLRVAAYAPALGSNVSVSGAMNVEIGTSTSIAIAKATALPSSITAVSVMTMVVPQMRTNSPGEYRGVRAVVRGRARRYFCRMRTICESMRYVL